MGGANISVTTHLRQAIGTVYIQPGAGVGAVTRRQLPLTVTAADLSPSKLLFVSRAHRNGGLIKSVYITP